MIEPGARAAAERTRSKKVGVIGTPGTIGSGAYQRALEKAGIQVTARACPLFVPLAEEGWTSGDVPRLVAREYVQGLKGIDTLVLGCTHYPLLHSIIAEAVGDGVVLVDSAEATAESAKSLLVKTRAFSEAPSARHAFFVTDVPERFRDVGARFLGRPIPEVQQIDLAF